jgi:SAM-dependent methyltransferase
MSGCGATDDRTHPRHSPFGSNHLGFHETGDELRRGNASRGRGAFAEPLARGALVCSFTCWSERARALREIIVISEIGLFIQHCVPRQLPALQTPGPGLPWPYRSVAEWWPDLVPNEAESHLLASFVRRSGEPALEVGFGMGRRLADCRAAGADIDGLEPSRGLYAACRAQFEQHGLSGHRLYSQPLHEIELPRRYRSIYAGRVLGTSASPDADAIALFRLYRALEPGGTLLFDHPAPWGDRSGWLGRLAHTWRPSPWPPPLVPCELRSACGREVLCLSGEVYEHTPNSAALTYTVHARHQRDGKLLARRGFGLRQRFYTTREVLGLLSRAGFDEPRVACAYMPEAERHVWVAEKVQRWRHTPVPPLGPIGLAGGIRVGA